MLTISKFISNYVINQQTGCWEWTAGKSAGGYGMMWVNGKMTYSHRWAYQYFIGLIPDTYQIDHLCRVRYCVNPDHLESVTSKENTRRGDHSRMGWNNKEKTHCPNNHEYSKENTSIKKDGSRRCKKCAREYAKTMYYEKVKK